MTKERDETDEVKMFVAMRLLDGFYRAIQTCTRITLENANEARLSYEPTIESVIDALQLNALEQYQALCHVLEKEPTEEDWLAHALEVWTEAKKFDLERAKEREKAN